MEPCKVYGYAGKVCHCSKEQMICRPMRLAQEQTMHAIKEQKKEPPVTGEIKITKEHLTRVWEAMPRETQLSDYTLWIALVNESKTPEDHFNEWLASIADNALEQELSSKDFFVAGFNVGRRK